MRIKRINEGMPDSAFNRLKQYAPRNYVVGVYWDVENPLGYHYEINSGRQVYTKVKSKNGYLGHFMIDSKPQNSVEEMENYAKKLIDKYDCKEVSNAEYERIVNESLTEDTVKTSEGKWTNKGKDGTHGKFKTKKEADAQRKAMFANGYNESFKKTHRNFLKEYKTDGNGEYSARDLEEAIKSALSRFGYEFEYGYSIDFITREKSGVPYIEAEFPEGLDWDDYSLIKRIFSRGPSHWFNEFDIDVFPGKEHKDGGLLSIIFIPRDVANIMESLTEDADSSAVVWRVDAVEIDDDDFEPTGKVLKSTTVSFDELPSFLTKDLTKESVEKMPRSSELAYKIRSIAEEKLGRINVGHSLEITPIKNELESGVKKLGRFLGKKLLPQRESVNRRLYFGKALNEKVSPDGYAPKKVGKAYKVFRVKNGKLYPPMVANAGGQDTPVGVWLDAEEGEFAGLSKTGRQQVKSIGSGTLAYRPGWHLGDVPRAPQFDRLNKETGEMEFPKDFVWAECDYAMDVDYQPEADEMGYVRTKVDDEGNVTTYKSDKYQHSLAGLKKLPSNGYYKYRTNPRPDTVPWVITGQMKVNRLLSDAEVNEILQSKGIAPIHRQGGDKTLAELGLGGISEAMEKDSEKSNVCPNCGTIMVKDATGMHCPKCDKQPKNDDVVEDFKDPDKMSKKDRKAYYSKQRNTWERNPVTKVKQSGKAYKRNKKVDIEESTMRDNFNRDDFEPSMPNDGFMYDDSDVDSLGKLPF